WDLVCDQEWLISLTKSVYMVGFLLSVSFFGLVSDCLGRFPALVMCYVINIFSMFGSLLSTSYIMFIVLRFFQAFGRAGITTIGYVLVMETVGPKHRAEVGIAVQLGWSTGFVGLAAVVWFIRDWFWLQLFLSCTFLPFLLTYNIVPESPRWLAMHGKTERLEKLMTKVAALNGKELKGDIRDMDLFKDKKEKTETLWGLLKKPKMRNRF
ncbi:solute carrier family 22 member 20, partial [Caerostris extrusa]